LTGVFDEKKKKWGNLIHEKEKKVSQNEGGMARLRGHRKKPFKKKALTKSVPKGWKRKGGVLKRRHNRGGPKGPYRAEKCSYLRTLKKGRLWGNSPKLLQGGFRE